MKILKSEFKNTEVGLFLETNSVQILFGNKSSTLENIQKHFPLLHFQRIKQTHSDICVQASDQIVEADGHFTASKNNALIISTADCAPVLIRCLQTNRIASVHAGWKGVANQIVLKTLRQLILTGSSQKKFEFWIGPHILQSSFEVDTDVFQMLAASAYNLSEKDFSYEKNSKFYVDLKKIIFSQIEEVIGSDFTMYLGEYDTKTNDSFWSFRRDKENAGRNLSFISLK